MVMKVKLMKVKCPHCGTRTDWQENPSRPFCSERCRNIDLGRWAEEEYRIAGDPAPPAQEGEE